MKGEEVDESALPVLPEEANAPKRFVHTKSGKAPVVHTLLSRYGHLASNNVSKTKFNSLEALKERYDKAPAAGAGVKVKKEAAAAAASMDDEAASSSASKLPSTMARRSRGRDRTSRAVTGSAAVKVEGEDGMGDDLAASAAASSSSSSAAGPSGVGPIDVEDLGEDNDDKIRYGEFGKPAHTRQDKSRSKHSRNRSKSKSKSGFLNWNKLASSA